jgi:hypothetical protein
MPRTVYALLVAIDRYPPPLPRLYGCANDARAMARYLKARVDSGGRDRREVLRIKRLVDRRATRQAVIDAFRTHLGRAGPGDVAFFCYSGHGSQEQAPEEFWHLEPDHLNETLVLYDSRDAARDLADKELAKLIAEVAAGGAHVSVLLDCCHSGSGTRAPDRGGPAVRRVEADPRPRPSDSYLAPPHELLTAGATRGLETGASGWALAGRHVLMAACRADEVANEYGTQGAFSHFLGEALSTAGGALTYHDLFTRAATLLRYRVRQSPQLEAPVPDDLRQPFLGGAILPAPRYFLVNRAARGWVMNAGRVHGIPALVADDPTVVALFDYTCADDDLARPERAVAQAVVSRVGTATSRLEITEGVPRPEAGPLKAVPLSLPVPHLRVRLEGDPVGIEAVRPPLAASPFVREAVNGEAADYRLLAVDGRYIVARPDDARPLAGALDGYSPGSARAAVDRLEHIERWTTTAGLDNPATSIRADEVRVEVLFNGQPLAGPEIRLRYLEAGTGEWAEPAIVLRLRNTGTRPLYVGLLDLPETFGIFPLLDNVGSQRLEPGEETFANAGEPIPVAIPDHLWERGVGELRDILKVIIGTCEFDARRLGQPDLAPPDAAAAAPRGITRGPEPRGTLERLMERVQTRHMGTGTARRIDDWRTLELGFSVVRPLPAAALQPGRAATLTHGVRIAPHPALRAASVRLATLSQASWATEHPIPLPRLLYDDPRAVQPFDLGSGIALGGVLNVLELTGLNDPALVTPDAPLRITVPRPLEGSERLLPLAFDGEFYLPLGVARSDHGETHVTLERLPRPDEVESRSPGRTLRILFHKVTSRLTDAVPVLAVARVSDDGEVHSDARLASLRSGLRKARRVALLVPGLAGDSRLMAIGLGRAVRADRYDLVLTFEYDPLQSSLADAARILAQRLSEAGLGPGRGKVLDVVAHSIGGLVARWFIEREEGSRSVRRLVMLGSPTGRAAWMNTRDWATAMLAVGLNELSPGVWPAGVMTDLVVAAQAGDAALRDAAPDSAFLRDLDVGAPPRVPSMLITGRPLLVSSRRSERDTQLRRLLDRLRLAGAGMEPAETFLDEEERDLAVSAERTVAECDHFSFFSSPEGLSALATALG